MNCTNCGAENKDGVKFCTNCGANLSQQMVQSEPEQAQTPTESMDVPATPEGAVPLQKRNTQRTIAIACGVLILLVVVFVGGLFLWKSLTPKELLLDADTIKDEAILNTLTVKYDKDGDGKLSEEELDEVQTLELDSGDDYSFLPFFKNLSSVTVKSSDVTSLDLSENSNLKSADFSNASNITDIKLPDMITYDEVKLPDNENLKVSLPENSEYEVKYVPKKVEETVEYKDGFVDTLETRTYTQDVQSSTKINSLTMQVQGESVNEIKYSYDSLGRITSWGQSNDIQYDENNRLKSEKIKINKSTSTIEATYDGAGKVSKVSKVADVKSDEGVIYLETSSIDRVSSYWKMDGDKLKESFLHSDTTGMNFAKLNYDWEGEYAKSLKLSTDVYDSEGAKMSLSSVEACSSMLSRPRYASNVSFVYESGYLVKASYDKGFIQNFSYDSHGNLTSVTSSGTSSVFLMNTTTASSIKYAYVIGKKDAEALNFLILPGRDKKGLFNQCADVRGITLAGTSSQYTAFRQDFSGKFWWDEENIINNQVEAAKARQGVEDSNSSADVVSSSNEALNKQAKEAYKSKISEYAKYQGANIKTFSHDTSGVNMLALFDFGTDVYYCLEDLNGDGVDELLIKCTNSNYPTDTIADAYTFADSQVKRILLSWERSFYKLCEGNVLKYHGSGGACEFKDRLCKFEGEFIFTEKCNYTTEMLAAPKTIMELGMHGGGGGSNVPYYFIGEDGVQTTVSDDVAKEKSNQIDSYQTKQVAWTPIIQNL